MARGDLAPQFSNTYPEILGPWVGEEEFRGLVGRVNAGLEGALGVGWGGVVDAVLGLVSGWLWDDAGLAGSKRRLKGVEGEIEAWNRGRGGRGGEEGLVRVVELRKSGFMSVSAAVADLGCECLDGADVLTRCVGSSISRSRIRKSARWFRRRRPLGMGMALRYRSWRLRLRGWIRGRLRGRTRRMWGGVREERSKLM